jgi:hypothetical protein
VEEFLKTYLKNKCSYARKQGYHEKPNQKQDCHEEEEEEEEEEGEEEGGGGKDKDKGKAREIEKDNSDFYGSDEDMPI